MKSSPRHRLSHPINKDVIALFAALLGIGVASWVTHFGGLEAGTAAIAVWVAIGIFTYKLGVIGSYWLTAFWRMGRKKERN